MIEIKMTISAPELEKSMQMLASALHGSEKTDAAPKYTLEQLCEEGAEIIRAGRLSELMELLKRFESPSIASLPKKSWAEFGVELQKLGKV